MNPIDARGLSCPQPLLMLRKAIASRNDCYIILVDNHAAKENVSRYANHVGYAAAISESDGDYTLTLTKT